MDLKFSDHHFSGDYLITAIDFMTTFVKEAPIQAICEAQAFIALPSSLKPAKSQCEAGIKMVSPEEIGVPSWPEAIQELLRNYA